MDHNRPPIRSDSGINGKLGHIVGDVFLLLPSRLIQPLAEVSLSVKQPDAHERDVEVGCTLDVIARQHSQSTGIHWQRLMQPEFCGKVGHGARTQDPGVSRAPGAPRIQIFPHAPVGVIDAAVQHQFRGTQLQLGQRKLAQQRYGILIQLPPPYRSQVQEQGGRIGVPTPPQVARESPEPLLRRRDEPVKGARFAHYRRNLGRGIDQ